MRYFNGHGVLTADPADGGCVFSVTVDRIDEVDAGCVENLRGKSTGGYVDTVRIDWTDDEQRVLSTNEIRIRVDTSKLTDEEFVAWLQLNLNRPRAAGILLPGDLMLSLCEL